MVDLGEWHTRKVATVHSRMEELDRLVFSAGQDCSSARQCQALLCSVWPHLALELARLQSGGHLHRPRLLQPPVDDEVEGEQRQEGEDGGGRHPGPGRVPHDVVLRGHCCEGTTVYVE